VPLACLWSFTGSFFPTHHPFQYIYEYYISSSFFSPPLFFYFFCRVFLRLAGFPPTVECLLPAGFAILSFEVSIGTDEFVTCIFGHHCQMHGSFQIPTPSCAWLSIPWRSRSRSEVPAIIVLSSCSPPPLRVTVRLVNKPVRLRGSPRIYKGVLVIC